MLRTKFNEIIKQAKSNNKIVIGQVAPTVSISGSVKKMGFDYIIESNSQLQQQQHHTIEKQGNDIIRRLYLDKMPVFVSSCPSWTQYMNATHPEFKQLLSYATPPHYATRDSIKDVFSKNDIVIIEIVPPQHISSSSSSSSSSSPTIIADDLAQWLKEDGYDDNNICIIKKNESTLMPLLEYIYEKLTNTKLRKHDVIFKPNVQNPSINESQLEMTLPTCGTKIKIDVAVINGMTDAKDYLNMMRARQVSHHIVEILPIDLQ